MCKFADMTADQLKQTLEKEIRKSAPDRNTVMACLKELKRRDAHSSPDRVLDAWEETPRKERRTHGGWIRIAAAAAIVVVLLLATVPQALGAESIFTKIGNWTKELFSFGEQQEKEFVYQTDHPGLQELYDTVTALGIEQNVVPTWLPEGYELTQLHTQILRDRTNVFASFIKDDKCISVSVAVFVDELYKDSEYQKSDMDAVVYEKNGIMHYIMPNNKIWEVAWFVNNMECSLSAENQDDLRRMVASIYKVEE